MRLELFHQTVRTELQINFFRKTLAGNLVRTCTSPKLTSIDFEVFRHVLSVRLRHFVIEEELEF